MVFEVKVKILLKHAGTKSTKRYHEEVTKIAKITISANSSSTSNIEMISVKELYSKKTVNPQSKQLVFQEP